MFTIFHHQNAEQNHDIKGEKKGKLALVLN
jgi:hypothetical protein